MRESVRRPYVPPGALHNDACPTCGTMTRPGIGIEVTRINGEEVRVPRVPSRRCAKCGERLYDMKAMDILYDGAFRIYRRKYRLLSPDEIRAIRERLGLTQAQLARLLRLGANTLSRWEAGRYVQTASMDVLLRLLRDVPGSVAYLKRRGR